MFVMRQSYFCCCPLYAILPISICLLLPHLYLFVSTVIAESTPFISLSPPLHPSLFPPPATSLHPPLSLPSQPLCLSPYLYPLSTTSSSISLSPPLSFSQTPTSSSQCPLYLSMSMFLSVTVSSLFHLVILTCLSFSNASLSISLCLCLNLVKCLMFVNLYWGKLKSSEMSEKYLVDVLNIYKVLCHFLVTITYIIFLKAQMFLVSL